jgi:hypothetical protein
LDKGPGEKGKTEEENDLSLLYHYDYLRLLNIDINKWSMDRRLGPINP